MGFSVEKQVQKKKKTDQLKLWHGSSDMITVWQLFGFAYSAWVFGRADPRTL